MTENLLTVLLGRRLRVSVGLAVLILACAVGYGLFTWGRGQAEHISVQWIPVRPQTLENELGLVGRLEAANRQTLSAPFDGVVKQLTVSEGQRVERSQNLLSLDTTQVDIQLRQASAELLNATRTVQNMMDWGRGEDVARARRAVLNAEFNLNDTEAKLIDTKRLFERGIVARMEVQALEQQIRLQRLDLAASQSELLAAQAKGLGDNRRIADMELANAEARYASIKAMQVQSELRAPFAGIILRPQKIDGPGIAVPVHNGQRVAQGLPLFELVSLELVHARAKIEEADLHQLREGMTVEVSGDGFNKLQLKGRVLSIGTQALEFDAYGGGSNYEVIVAVEPLTVEQLEHVRLGMTTRLAVSTYRVEHGFAVPTDVLRQDSDGSTYVSFRNSLEQSPRRVTVVPGRAVPQGVEVFGLEEGFVGLTVRQK